jgi:hypothetical protein
LLDQLNQREIWRASGVRRAAYRENLPALQTTDRFVDEARLPDAGLSDDADDLPMAPRSACASLTENFKLGGPPSDV